MSVSEINFCIQCGNSVTGSKYCSKCGNEVASTVLAPKENNVGLKGSNQVKENKLAKKLRNEAKQPDLKVGAAIFNKYAKKIEDANKEDYKKILKSMESELIKAHPSTFGGEEEIDKLFKELKKKKTPTIKEAENLYNNDKISLDELPKKPSKDSSNNTKYKWGTFLGPYILAIYTTLSIPPIEMAFDGFGGFITFFARLLPSFIATSFVAIMLVCISLLIACLTFLIGKGKSFWNVAFILSIIISGIPLLTKIMGY